MRPWNNDFDRRFRIMQRFILGFIAVVLTVIIGFWITMGVLAFKASDEIGERGLKAVIEQIWCGPNDKCL